MMKGYKPAMNRVDEEVAGERERVEEELVGNDGGGGYLLFFRERERERKV